MKMSLLSGVMAINNAKNGRNIQKSLEGQARKKKFIQAW